MTWIWWGPLIVAALHISEEFVFPGGFAEWDRMYRRNILASITRRFTHCRQSDHLSRACHSPRRPSARIRT